ncbi:hypothetical protein [Lysobacter gummosus]
MTFGLGLRGTHGVERGHSSHGRGENRQANDARNHVAPPWGSCEGP